MKEREQLTDRLIISMCVPFFCVCVCGCVCTCIWVFTGSEHKGALALRLIQVSIHVCVCVYVCIYRCVCVCVSRFEILLQHLLKWECVFIRLLISSPETVTGNSNAWFVSVSLHWKVSRFKQAPREAFWCFSPEPLPPPPTTAPPPHIARQRKSPCIREGGVWGGGDREKRVNCGVTEVKRRKLPVELFHFSSPEAFGSSWEGEKH